MSFELKNVSRIFQKLINDTLRSFLNVTVIAYLDDILIYSKEKSKHRQHIQKVLKAFRRKTLTIKTTKSQFHTQKIKFLKFVIKSKMIEKNSNKIETIQQ